MLSNLRPLEARYSSTASKLYTFSLPARSLILSVFSMYWSPSDIRNLPLATSPLLRSDSRDARASSSVNESENATSAEVAGAKHSRCLVIIRSTAEFLSTAGWSALEYSHFPFPVTAVLATLYMDSSFLIER